MVEAARRFADLDGMPRVEFDTVASFWNKLRAESPDVPVWVGELYLEFHRGTYTTNGPIKRANRRNEQALRAAELWSVAACAGAGDWSAYPAEQLDALWKLLLLNQFHDIIPGSSIHWANEDCMRDHERIAALTEGMIAAARNAVASDRHLPATDDRWSPFNGVATAGSWSRSSPASLLESTCPCGYSVVDLERARHHGASVCDGVLENELLRHLGRRRTAHLGVRQGTRRESRAAGNAATCSSYTTTTRRTTTWNVDIDYLDSGRPGRNCRRSRSSESGPQRRGALRARSASAASCRRCGSRAVRAPTS
jgi:hypothetical protein